MEFIRCNYSELDVPNLTVDTANKKIMIENIHISWISHYCTTSNKCCVVAPLTLFIQYIKVQKTQQIHMLRACGSRDLCHNCDEPFDWRLWKDLTDIFHHSLVLLITWHDKALSCPTEQCNISTLLNFLPLSLFAFPSAQFIPLLIRIWF